MLALKDRLTLRALAVRSLRGFFDQQHYLEINSPTLVRAPGLEPHLRAFELKCSRGQPHFLITSPEFQLKRLLCAGFERIYYLGPCYRDEEHGPHHAAEFTMLEWYRSGSDSAESMIAETEALVRATYRALPAERRRPLAVLESADPLPQLSVSEAFARYAGLELDSDALLDADVLLDRARRAGHVLRPGAYDQLFSELLVSAVEPRLLAEYSAVFLRDYPAPLAALARLDPLNPRLAQRFELYLCGMEICNAFVELTDAREQRQRFEADLAARFAIDGKRLPLDQRFLESLDAGMPVAVGNALGVDRLLVALIDGLTTIEQVRPFAGDEL
ncbi:MAG: EF-P lysine aminoacylase GenX [Deltaproteobacteria bacterium]|nr:EF-P lysine aminoacylase GenX [Deltaproteobacteria bacterium]